MKTYKVTGPRPVLGAAPGSELEHEFTAEEERDMLDAGRLELLPREYRNVGTRPVFGAEPGGTFTEQLTVGQEQALLEGDHIEIVAKKAPKTKKEE